MTNDECRNILRTAYDQAVLDLYHAIVDQIESTYKLSRSHMIIECRNFIRDVYGEVAWYNTRRQLVQRFKKSQKLYEASLPYEMGTSIEKGTRFTCPNCEHVARTWYSKRVKCRYVLCKHCDIREYRDGTEELYDPEEIL